jgi:peptidoglycan/LPS O-acetylase OafA/YrhL
MNHAFAHSQAGAGARAHVAVLDGVRGLAIVMVMCVHFVGDSTARTTFERGLVKLANYGVWGVDLFFVLSGFLITGLLYDSKKDPHYFRNFYVRRTLRIFPLYYAILALLFIIGPRLPGLYPPGLTESAHHQAWLWLYASNVYLAIHRAWALPFVGHFWSLAVEEQFYLVWPIVVLSFGLRSLLRICLAVTVLSLGLRCVLSIAGAGDVPLTVLTPCRFDALCVGGFLALSVRSSGLETVARAGRWALGPLVGLVVLASACNAMRVSLSSIVVPMRGTLIALTFGALLVASLASKASGLPSRLLRSRVMCFLGTRSYGLYVFHGIIAYGMGERHALLDALATRIGSGPALFVEVGVGAGASVLAAAASYELFEKHFLRLKNRLAPSAARSRVVGILDAGAAE